MTVAHIWIFLPIFAAILLFVMNRFRLFNYLVATILTLLLSFLAWGVQPDVTLDLGLAQFLIRGDLILAGRVFHFDKALLNFVGLLNLGAFFWFGGSWFVDKARSFYAVSLAIIGFITAAISIKPYLYAALLYEMVVILSVPILFFRSNQRSNLSVSRYLVYQTLGYMMLLLAGWGLNAIDSLKPDMVLVNTTVVLFIFALGILLALFPFYTWLSSLVSEENLYTVSFIFSLMAGFLVVIALKYFDTNIINISTVNALGFIRLMGVVTMLVASLAILFEQNLSRLFAFLVTIVSSKIVILFSFKASMISLLLSLTLGSASLTLFSLALSTLSSLDDELGVSLINKIGLIVGCAGVIGVPLLGDFRGVAEIESLLVENQTFVTLFVFTQILLYLGWARLLIRLLPRGRLFLHNERIYVEPNISHLILLLGVVTMICVVNFPKLVATVLQFLLAVRI